MDCIGRTKHIIFNLINHKEMRTIKLNEDEVKTLFRLIYQQTSNLDRRLAEVRKERMYSVGKFIMDDIRVLDGIGKKMMHSREMEVQDDDAY